MASLYSAMGDYARAEPLYRQALAIYKQALGEKHPDYSMALSELSLFYQTTGNYAAAEPLAAEPWRSASKLWAKSIPITPKA